MAHLLLLLALFIGVHVSASDGFPLSLTAYNESMCLESKCGSVDIKYPFYLSNATERNPEDYTTYSCGYTDLKIFCHGDGDTKTPILRLGEANYTIRNIFYDNRSITLVDTDALSGKCPSVRHNVTMDPEWLNYTDSLDSLKFFFGCAPRPDVEDHQIDCKGFSPPAGSGNGVSFVFTSEEDKLSRENLLAEHCNKIVFVPVHEDGLMRSGSVRLPLDYGAVVKEGFELAWKQSTQQPCHACEQSYGRCAYSESKEYLGCLCSGGKIGVPDCYNSGNSRTGSTASASRAHSKNKRKIYIIASTIPLVFLLFALLLGSKKYLSRKKSKETIRIESFLQKNGTIYPKRYTYTEVKRLTKSFTEKLGQGGFGAVYRGGLSDGRQIAVKMLKSYKTDGEDFINEVASISKTSHVNVVTLLGFCLEGSKRALIYDYMPNGSLEKYAFKDNSKGEDSQNTLGWEKLFDIAVGIARGLEYLHRGCNTRIVHFDIKPHNILLDQNFCPKISDFGLAKLCLNKESAISIGGARGTIGYIAPEVFSKQFGAVSSKSDVYSYGMMVLEMVGARDKNIYASSASSSQYFPQWIYEHLDEYCVGASEIDGEITEIVRKMIVVGLWCIQLSATNRPTMTRVVEMLEGNTSDLELPPKVLLIS
ncbi:LEAF RUST 10 DISEASE-RESISTANCE LOCUS RECEPTOR-LIKE PROTEIN KINASE-like 2.1 isoform X2 [Brachypodium distachyon]|uniref:LEAF RUST 10 DISEASE-RESISTANCE LOCUS RECEPTOR-LIKE PROTEIN KINASE-like 2.1 isoform X2 n=1 Tax=Brachypodium distachyon TaxID=15368 RepID=UPI000D0DA7F3|nr:LEAF RUST 10 DISEASE-RESISTANCE LOCUS RECEPTOR-LIKE PROTEIN KINASE-like 2.1 isoform X2 [Brachypodium distachyon]|eukprot:XP_024315009.1 LEAF RUST 10 DISEASE-RESISTANCE LOCUS RECEPTOR-LIKE PROTEIN KINASE-like 2.1 isoform X2 [Brachypodium distachyon]